MRSIHARIPLSRLVNVATIARRAGVTPANVSQWRNRHPDFPEPLPTPGVTGILLWDWEEVCDWLSHRRVRASWRNDRRYNHVKERT